MIVSFKDAATQDLFNGVNSARARNMPQVVRSKGPEKLDNLNYATSIQDLRIPPSNCLEELSGNYIGFHSIRINKQFRVIFRWIDGNAYDVHIADYHP